MPRLAALGVRRVSVPRMLPAAAIRAMEQALALFRHAIETGEVVDRPDLLASIEDIKALMDYAELERLEERFLLPDHLLHKYGSERVKI
jgi:2-methylisocitrate lyase-like PEP mutase family enzyme